MRAFVDHLANGWAGREGRSLLRSAGFGGIASIPFVSMPPLPVAFETVLRGDFFCAVVVVVTVGSNS